jgi:hypothetical protein
MKYGFVAIFSIQTTSTSTKGNFDCGETPPKRFPPVHSVCPPSRLSTGASPEAGLIASRVFGDPAGLSAKAIAGMVKAHANAAMVSFPPVTRTSDPQVYDVEAVAEAVERGARGRGPQGAGIEGVDLGAFNASRVAQDLPPVGDGDVALLCLLLPSLRSEPALLLHCSTYCSAWAWKKLSAFVFGGPTCRE